MRLLLIYYHPIILDLAETFARMCDQVDVAVNPTVKDNYGGYAEHFAMIDENIHLDSKCIPLPLALNAIKKKEYDLVGLDGVFDGDKLAMDVCKEAGIPYFCINGYPHLSDEPSDNILSFSHFLPQNQYKRKFQWEPNIKIQDWQDIAKFGQSQGKNIFVYYPEMNEAKRFAGNVPCFGPFVRKSYVSLIHRYEECNKWNYEVFKRVKSELEKDGFGLENFSGLPQREVYKKITTSLGLCHLKHGDCPGISLLEALILGQTVFTMRSFVNASFNQEVLIDGLNSVIADDVDELIARMKNHNWGQPEFAEDYIWDLTSFNRQRVKLERFFQKCLK